MRLFVFISAFVLSAGAALASGGINCSAEADGVAFEVGGGVSRGMGAALFSFEGTLAVADPDVADDLAKTSFAREHVAQYWLDGEELRLVLYREREGDKPHGYAELTIRTKAQAGDDGEGVYDGRYTLSVFDMAAGNDAEGATTRREGDVSCFAE